TSLTPAVLEIVDLSAGSAEKPPRGACRRAPPGDAQPPAVAPHLRLPSDDGDHADGSEPPGQRNPLGLAVQHPCARDLAGLRRWWGRCSVRSVHDSQSAPRLPVLLDPGSASQALTCRAEPLLGGVYRPPSYPHTSGFFEAAAAPSEAEVFMHWAQKGAATTL